MELSSQGTILTWFGLAMGTVSIVFSTPLLLLVVFAAFAILAIRAARFRQDIKALRDHFSIEIDPANVSTLANRELQMEVVLTNSSTIPSIVGDVNLRIPSQIKSEPVKFREQLLPSQSSMRIQRSMTPTLAGLFRISRATVTLEDKSRLLKHVLRLRCSMMIGAKPQLSMAEPKIDISDPTRYGFGTDLAGIREAVSEDDFRVIDWKSTARTGKFMAKQFYPDTEPPAIIAVERSVLTGAGDSQSNMLLTITKLVVALRPSSRVGLIVYDENRVRTYIPPSADLRSNEQIIDALVTASGLEEAATQGGNVTRLYGQLVSMIRNLEASQRSASKPRRSIDVFAKNVLPYYESAASRYALNLHRQGAFHALQMLLTASQPALVIIIAAFKNDLSGLCEVATLLNATEHRTIIAIIGSSRDVLPPEVLTLRQSGVLVVHGSGAELPDAIRRDSLTTPRIRNVSRTPL